MEILREILLTIMDKYITKFADNVGYEEWDNNVFCDYDFDEIAKNEKLFNHAIFVFNSIINQKNKF